MRSHLTAERGDGGQKRMPRALRAWAITQRMRYKSGRLSSDRIAKLRAIGFDWTPHESRWQRLYEELREFQRKNNHCRVPAEWYENPQLAHWEAVQRAARRAGRLSDDRIGALDALGFVWVIASNGSDASRAARSDWQEMFEKVKAFREAHGHFVFPQKTPLADWAIAQRILRRRKRLAPEREQALNNIGFDWDPITNRWERMFKELLEFRARYGHVDVAQKSREHPKLAAWVAKQRFDKKHNRPILRTRAPRLDEIGFTWAFAPMASWEQRFEELLGYKEQYGDCKVPQHWKENKQLGKWVNTQRTQLKRGKLSDERKAKLDSIDFVWDTKSKPTSLPREEASNLVFD